MDNTLQQAVEPSSVPEMVAQLRRDYETRIALMDNEIQSRNSHIIYLQSLLNDIAGICRTDEGAFKPVETAQGLMRR